MPVMARIDTLLLSFLAAASRFHVCMGADDDTQPPRVIDRDVVIIGGGASGAHAALRLKDMGQSIALVEMQSTLVWHSASTLIQNG